MSDLTDEQITEYRSAFSSFDKDNNGEIDVDELRFVFKQLGVFMDDEQLGTLIRQVDTDENGIIDFEEFLTLMQLGQEEESEEADMLAAFKEFDLDGDGFIDKEELKNVMVSLGEEMSEEELRNMMKNADSDGDGQVDYNEFVKMMKDDEIVEDEIVNNG